MWCVRTVSLSVCQNKIIYCQNSYTTRKIIYPSFGEKKNGWWRATPFYLKFRRENADFQSIDKMLSYRIETALQGALVLAKSGRLELEDNILRT